MKINYKNWAEEIVRKAKANKVDHRDYLRQVVEMFESFNIKNWSRDEFLDVFSEVLKEANENK